MELKKILLRFVFLNLLLILQPSILLGISPKITIEKEGRTPTDEELAWARNAFSEELAEVRTSQNIEYAGFKANPIVNAAASIAAYREGKTKPYFFRMFMPKEIKPKKKYPLILWLHGYGESLSDNECQMAHMQTSIDILAGPNRPDFYLVAVQCPVETHSWMIPDPRAPNHETPLQMLDKITKALIEEYPIEINQISLLGICTGGVAGFELIKEYPKRFSSFAACSSNVPSGLPSIYCHQPIWLFNNQDDSSSWKRNIEFAEAVNKARGDMYVTLHKKGGHNSWTSAQRDDHIIEWLLRQRRGRFAFPRNAPVLDHSKKEVFFLFVLPMLLSVIFIATSLHSKDTGQ